LRSRGGDSRGSTQVESGGGGGGRDAGATGFGAFQARQEQSAQPQRQHYESYEHKRSGSAEMPPSVAAQAENRAYYNHAAGESVGGSSHHLHHRGGTGSSGERPPSLLHTAVAPIAAHDRLHHQPHGGGISAGRDR
ncbi:unnamed protein product, partial [Ectocarpus sp. 8 AP-2014]